MSVLKAPVIIPKPRQVKMYRDLAQFHFDPKQQPRDRFNLLRKDVGVDPSITPEIEEKLFFKRKAGEQPRILEIGLLAFPRRDYGSVLQKMGTELLSKHNYRSGGIGGFFGFVMACPHVTCPGVVLALGRDMSQSRDIILGVTRCSHELPDKRRVVAERLSRLGKNILPSLSPEPLFVIIVKDIV